MISIWEKESFYAPQDVIIAGSGFVGLWAAFYLKKKHPRLKISIVDRGIIPTGASTRNAGFACFGSLSEVVYDARTMGQDKMLNLVEMRFRGLERIRKHFSKELIDFELCGGYELYETGGKIHSGELRHNIDYINSLLKSVTGVKKTYRLADERIREFGFGLTQHLVLNKLEGYLHSGKLVQALLQKVQGMGVQVFTGTEILSYKKEEDGIVLHTAHIIDRAGSSLQFKTAQLLICTNAFARQLLPQIDIVPARGQVLLTSPIEGLSLKGSFHSDEGFYYFRNLGNRVLLGGARNKAFSDEETEEMTTSAFIQEALENYLDKVVLPGYRDRYNIEHRWAGIMAMGSEKMPIVQEVEPGVYCAVRMSGMGVALAPVVAQQVMQLMRDGS